MGRLFDITTTNDALTLDASGRGQIAFTVTNTASRPVRGRLKTKALDSGDPGWITVAGEAERDFSPNSTQQVTVNVAVPKGTSARKFSVRLDGVSVENPDEDFTEGPAVGLEVRASEPEKPFPWWILVVVGVVLVVGGVIAYLLLSKTGGVEVPAVTGKPYSEALAQIEKLGLKGKRQEQASGAEPQGKVLKQEPEAGKKAKKGTEVVLIVAVAPPRPPTPPVTREFVDPRVRVAQGDLPLDVCREWATNCGKPAADAYCNSNGFAEAIDFHVAQDSPPTVVIGTKQVCSGQFCDRITWIKCSGARGNVITLNPGTLRYLEQMHARGKQAQ